MKKIITTLCIFYFTILGAFAEINIDISSDKKDYNIEDTITLTVTIRTDEASSAQAQVQGIDDFQVIGQNQTRSSTSINGVAESLQVFKISLLAPREGIYTLGPVVLDTGDDIIESGALEINITGERIMVNNKFDTLQKNLGIQKVEEDNNQQEEENIEDIDLGASSGDEEIIAKKILGVDGEEMKDVYPNKDYLYGNPVSKKSLWFLVMSVLGIIAFAIAKKYLGRYLEKQELLEKEKIKNTPIPKKKVNYKKMLNNLEKKYLDSDKEIFYGETATVLRTYLDDKVSAGLSKKSLQEIENYFSDSRIENKSVLLAFYKKIYFPEYNKQEDTKDQRISLLLEFKKIIL